MALLAGVLKVGHLSSARGRLRRRRGGLHRRQRHAGRLRLHTTIVHLLARAPVAHAPEMEQLQREFVDGQTQRADLLVALRDTLLQGVDLLLQRV